METMQETGIRVPATGEMTARERFIEAVQNAGGSRAVAARLAVTRSYIDMLKSGDRRPGIATAFRIQQVFAIPMEAWLTSEEARQDDARAGQ